MKPKMVPARAAALAVLVAVVAAAAYAPVLGYGFVALDDDVYVTANSRVQEGLTAAGIRWAFELRPESRDFNFYWQPLTWISLMLDRDAWGLDARGFHGTNLLLHAASAALLFLLLRAVSGRNGPAFAAALLYSLHPLNVEAVAWIVERKSVLSAFLVLLSLLAWVAWTRRPTAPRYAAALLLFALALAAKPSVLVLPAFLVLLRTLPLGSNGPASERSSTRRLAIESAPFLLLSCASAAVTLFSLQKPGFSEPDAARPLALRAANAAASLPVYLGKAIWPVGLGVFYPFPQKVPAWKVAAALVLVAAVTAAAVHLRRHRPWLLLGWAWFLAALVPHIGLRQAGLWPSLADRFTYLALPGLLVAVCWEADARFRELRERSGPSAAAHVAPLLLAAFPALALFSLTRAQVRTWRDSESLFRQALAAAESAEMRNDLAGTLLAAGRVPEAIREYEAALAVQPDLAGALMGIVRAYAAAGRTDDAALALARLERVDRGGLRYLLEAGSLLLSQGRLAEASTEFARAVAIDAASAPARFNLGETLRRLGRLSEAAAQLEEARRLEPSSDRTALPLADVYERLGSASGAIAALRRWTARHTEDAAARGRLGLLLGESGRLPEAIAELGAAVRLAPRDAALRNNFGTALLLAGRRDLAAAEFRVALRLDPSAAEARANLAAATR